MKRTQVFSRIAALLATGALAISLFGCSGGSSPTSQGGQQSGPTASEQSDSSDVAEEEVTASITSTQLVDYYEPYDSSDFTYPDESWAKDAGEYYKALVNDPVQALEVHLSFKNNTDTSLSASLYFSVTIDEKDEYGDTKEREVEFYAANYGGAYSDVPLAPFEERDTVCYITEATILPNSKYGPEQESDFMSKVRNLEISRCSVDESDLVYVPISDIDLGYSLLQDMTSQGDRTTVKESIEGAVTNTTDARWQDACVKFSVMVDGHPVNTSATGSGNYITTGGTFDYTIPLFTHPATAGRYDVEVTPYSFWYAPERG